jgi:hypothetical protein
MANKSETPKAARTATAAPPHATIAGDDEDRRPTRPYDAETDEPTARVSSREDQDDAELDLDLDVGDADEAIESSGQRAGMGRGEKPRKLKSEE